MAAFGCHRCECKELVNWSSCEDDMENTSTCDYECDKAWKIGEYFDIKPFSCRKRLFDELALAFGVEILNQRGETSIVDKR